LQSEQFPTADVSVVIPAYRAVDTIGRALASVAAQSAKPLEVIVVDDGSKDGTFEAASALKGALNGIELKVFTQDNTGAGAARNKAVAEANGTYIAFLDADDEWLPEKIERSLAIIHAGDHVLVAHDCMRIESNGDQSRIDCARRFEEAADPYTSLYRQGYLGTSTVVVRREAVLAAGSFDENLATAQDFDLWLKILGRPGASFTVFADVLMKYHVSAGSITTFTARRLACTLRIAERHFCGSGNLLFRICAVHFEAISAYWGVGRPLAAFAVLLLLPWRLVRSAMNIPGKEDAAPAWIKNFLWLWVIIGCGAYVYRFEHLGLAFLNMLRRL
jgi:teichuronic acid biosynthesis glycosyltransferase TuaG